MPSYIKNVNVGPYAGEEQEIAKKRKLAEMLQSQSMEPLQAPQGGAFPAAISPLHVLAKGLQAYKGNQASEEAKAKTEALAKRQQEERSAQLAAALRQGMGAEAPAPELGGGPAMPANPVAGMSTLAQSADPVVQQMGMGPLQAMQAQQKQAQDMKFRASESAEARAAREAQAAQQRQFMEQQAAAQRAQQADMARLQASLRTPPQQRNPIAVIGPDGKPILVSAEDAVGKRPYNEKAGKALPPAALKMQNEILEDIGTSGAINSDLASIGAQLQSGALKLGPVANLANQGLNYIGRSTEESRNFQSFQSTLEKLRNDSLRLNKGVQTEGDAQRAWNELIKNINDPKVVAQRIQEIQAINQRAGQLKKIQLEQMRSNFGLESFDTEPVFNQPAAVGANRQSAPQTAPQRSGGLSPQEQQELEALRARFRGR